MCRSAAVAPPTQAASGTATGAAAGTGAGGAAEGADAGSGVSAAGLGADDASLSCRRGQPPRPKRPWIRRTHEPQSVPALLAEAIWRGVQAPVSACSRTCCSVMPKQEHTYTRLTSLRSRLRFLAAGTAHPPTTSF